MQVWRSGVTCSSRELKGKLWRLLAPGLVISECVILVNFICDGLRDAVDPKAKLV